MVRVTQLSKVQRPGCELAFFGMEQIPLPPHQAAAGHRVTTDEPQSKIGSHRVCPPGPSCFISHRKAMCNSGLSTIHHIYGALWGLAAGGRVTLGGLCLVQSTSWKEGGCLYFVSLLLCYQGTEGEVASLAGLPRGSTSAGLDFEAPPSTRE